MNYKPDQEIKLKFLYYEHTEQDYIPSTVRYYKSKGLIVTIEKVYADGYVVLGIWKRGGD